MGTRGDNDNWRIKASNLLSRTSVLANSQEMSDVSFIFKGSNTKEEQEIVYGHKLILGMASPVFYKMFYNDQFATSSSNQIQMDLNPLDSAAFLTFIKFFYTDKIDYEHLDVDHIVGILHCSDFYDVPYVKKECVDKLVAKLEEQNVILLLETALLFGEKDMAQRALDFVDKNAKSVFESDAVLDVKLETIFEILQRESLNIEETLVLVLALRWAEANCKRRNLESTDVNKRAMLGKAFFEIRFPLLPANKIAELVRSNLLTQKESLEMLLLVHSTTGKNGIQESYVPEVLFKAKERIFGIQTTLNQSVKYDLKLNANKATRLAEKQMLDYWKSIAKVQADLHIKGLRNKTEDELKTDIEMTGSVIDVKVHELGTGRTRRRFPLFRVQFYYNPSLYEMGDFMCPNFWDFDLEESPRVVISEWVERQTLRSPNVTWEVEDSYEYNY